LLQIETEAKPITNQKNSGRCWIFATLNVILIPFIKEHDVEEFEFSQAYLFFWDKVRQHPGIRYVVKEKLLKM
jgi:bleomycin hydrolase